jgi:hypothetical protein
MTLSALEIIERARYAHWAAYLAGLRCEAMPVPRARRSFATLLTKFLKTRLEAASRRDTEGRPGGAGAPDLPGLEVTVHTERSGLLVYYSPLYYPATRRVFGGTPSTQCADIFYLGSTSWGQRVEIFICRSKRLLGRSLPITQLRCFGHE